MLQDMARVQIIGTTRCLEPTIHLLQRLGTVQIETWQQERTPWLRRFSLDEVTLQRRERLAYLATRVDAVLTALPVTDVTLCPATYDALGAQPTTALIDAIERVLTSVETQTQALTRQRDQLVEQQGLLTRYETSLQQLLPLIPALVDLDAYAVAAVWIERRYEDVLALLHQRLIDLTGGRCEILSRELDHETMAAVLVFPKAQVEAVNALLGREHLAQIRLPGDFTGQPFDRALAHIRQRLQRIPQELDAVARTLHALARTWGPHLLAWQALLHDRLDQIDVRTAFAGTDYTFVIEGWIPQTRLPDLQTAVQHEVGDEVLVTVRPLHADERARAPVLFDHARLVQPFEPLLGLLALPRPGGIDPTPLMALFLPLFFGMMLGDVAYGAILLALMAWLRRRFRAHETLRRLCEVLMFGAAWGAVFGVFYGEYFGTLGHAWGLRPVWFDRGADVQALFLLALGIGAGHTVLGLCLGAWEALRQRLSHVVVEKLASLLSLMALFFMAGSLTDVLPAAFFSPAVAALVVGLAMLIYSMGGLGGLLAPLELLGLIGNVLSYLRIAAIGLASVYLAHVANALAGVLGNLLVGLIIATLFHALNMALGAFSPTIQSLRLHYVEFFSKFYQGGGQQFHPFCRRVVGVPGTPLQPCAACEASALKGV